VKIWSVVLQHDGDENRTGNHSVDPYFAVSFFKVLSNANIKYLKTPKKASRASENALACRVFETPAIERTALYGVLMALYN